MKKKISMTLAIVLLLSPIFCMAEFSGFLKPYGEAVDAIDVLFLDYLKRNGVDPKGGF